MGHFFNVPTKVKLSRLQPSFSRLKPNGTWLSRKPLSPLGLPQRKCDWPATRRPPTNPSSFLAACGFGRRRREKKKEGRTDKCPPGSWPVVAPLGQAQRRRGFAPNYVPFGQSRLKKAPN